MSQPDSLMQTSDLPHPTILVVDDSKTLRNVVRRSLTMAGVADDTIAEAVDGQDALEQIRLHRPDLVISDVNMPRMSGVELLRVLREDATTQDLPVVIITSVSNSRALLDVVRLGASKVIRKPFDPVSLPDMLERFLPKPPAPPALVAVEPIADEEDENETIFDRISPVDGSDEELWRDKIAQSMADVLEKMIFAEAVPVDDMPPQTALLVGARIDIQNARIVCLEVSASIETARELAGRILGSAIEDDDWLSCFDCVGELANMLVGDLLGSVAAEADAEDATTFSVPRRLAIPPGGALSLPPRAFSLDGGDHRIYVGVTR